MWTPDQDSELHRYFAGITEHAFFSTLGIADPPLIDYLSTLLTRFIHQDSLFRLHDMTGNRLTDVLEMVQEAEALPAEGRTRREYHRHIGDFTLFWTGLFPDGVTRSHGRLGKDLFVAYCRQGKKSYSIASEADDSAETPILRRLSFEFETCAYGLHQVRKDFEAIRP